VFDTYAESVAHPKLENSSGDYDALIRDSVRLNMADRNKQSEEAADRAIKVRPEGASAYFLRGLSRLLEHHYPTALDDMRTAERLAKDKSISFPILNYGQVMPSHYEVSEIVFFEGCIELTQKDYKAARTDLDRAISMHQVGDYYKARANLFRSIGRIKDAEHDEAVAAKISPKPGSKNLVIKEPLETLLAP
jgi:tetratricopeptide (TPR) repeat protein